MIDRYSWYTREAADEDCLEGEQEFSRVADPANIQRIRQTVAGS